MRRRLAVILMADLVEYSRMMAEDEARAISLIHELRNTYLEPVVEASEGELLKRMGDGWIFAFSSIQSAVECAVAIQKSLSGHKHIKLRMAAHIGEIVEDEDDFYGAGVNLTQRLETQAPPGGLLISEDLFRQLPRESAEVFEDAGSFRLKNIPLPVSAYQWRLLDKGSPTRPGELPTILVEEFDYAPEDSETKAIISDLRNQLVLRLSQRSGIRIIDGTGLKTSEALYLLRGRMRIADEKGRLALSLLFRDSGSLVWSGRYEANTDDPFKFCDELVERIDVDLRIQINAFDGQRLATLRDDELSLSELRARAANLFYDGSLGGHERAKELLERAIRLDPDDGMSLAMHVEATSVLAAAKHHRLDKSTLNKLETEINKALETMPRSDYVRCVRAEYHLWHDINLEEAKKDIDRCLAITPNYPYGLMALGLYSLCCGDFNDSFEALQQAVDLSEKDPLLPQILFFSTLSLICAGRLDEALQQIEHAIELRPSEWAFHTIKAICLDRTGAFEAAQRATARAEALPRKPSIYALKTQLPASYEKLWDELDPRQ